MELGNALPLPVLVLLCCGSAWAQQTSEATRPNEVPEVTRVRRPDFSAQKSDLWYDDVFKEGLVGKRPDAAAANAIASRASGESKGGDEDSGSGWSALIDGAAIEDEIKALNLELAKTVTTPVKFKTAYNDVRQTMALLSMAFGIVREYDGEVRWKDHAANAQAAFQKATISARSNADTSFNFCNGRKFELEDLVRGGSFAEVDKPPAELEWADVVGRTETMVRLQRSDELLKEWTADAALFAKQKKKIIQEAQWVAAIAEVIAKEGMDDADVDDYVAFCEGMKAAALDTVAAAKLDNFDGASKAANRVSQSCNDCHQEWR